MPRFDLDRAAVQREGSREEDIHRALRGETVPPAPVEASPLESTD